MTEPIEPLCFDCIHKHGVGKYTCNAYPGGIPFEILTSEVDHHFPYKGDHNIQYEKDRNPPKVVPFPHVIVG